MFIICFSIEDKEVCVDFDYFDGAWKPISLNVKPLNGKTIINTKKVKSIMMWNMGKIFY